MDRKSRLAGREEEILALANECSTMREVAVAMGVPDNTLRGFLNINDNAALKSQVRAALAGVKQNAAKAAVVEQPPVTDPARIRAEQDRATIATLRRENSEYSKALAAQEEFFDRIVEASRVPVEVPKITQAKQNPRLPARSVITPIFDQQFGQLVNPLDTPGGKGAYSVEIFDHRLERWLEGVTGNIRDYAASHRIEELIIPLGGDQVEGDEIFAGQAWQLELDPPQQVVQLSCKMDAALRHLVRFAREEIGVKFVSIYGVDDNHGKVGGKKSGARPATYSWNWLFQTFLYDKLRAEPIDEMISEPGGSLFFRAAGHEFQLIHGHQVKGWGGLPFYGLAKHDGRSIRMHSRIYRYLLMGHHHQSAEIPNGAGETIVSGDWVGANNLSGMINAASRPQQKILFVAPKWGITETARIYFQEADEAYAPSPIYGRER